LYHGGPDNKMRTTGCTRRRVAAVASADATLQT